MTHPGRGKPWGFLALLVLTSFPLVISNGEDYEYSYGDPNVGPDDVLFINDELEGPQPPEAVKTFVPEPKIPLCCEEGFVLDIEGCVAPPKGYLWTPTLNGAPNMKFEHKGLPSCEENREHIDVYQKEVMFDDKAMLFLPYYVHLDSLGPENYCVSKVLDPDASAAKAFQTKVFACLDRPQSALMWVCVGVAHFLLLATLVTYFAMHELRCLQGQYMICLLISLLIYNVCLLPLSEISLDISDVSCIALGAVKYFFFCGVFLWFNVMCFDVWRTLSNRQDVSGRRRFLLYSAYSWLIGAVLTTVVLVLPYTRSGASQGSTNDPVRDGSVETCKLNTEMDMILQLAQLISLLLDLVCLILATCNMCGYDQLGNGLLRTDASLCLKQCWKLFAVMLAHVLSTIDSDIIYFPIPQWQYLLLESVAICGVFAFRKTLIRQCVLRTCGSQCHSTRERGTLQEKNQLTLAA